MEPPVMMDTVPDYFQFAAQDGGFPAGFSLEDDMMSRGRQDIRSHLDDLAQRHPEFADHLKCPPWGGEMGDTRTWARKRRGSGSVDDDARSQASGASSSSTEQCQPDGAEHQENQEEPGPLRGRPRPGNLPQYGLRNTVDLGQQQHESEQDKQGRGQRSMSAPPDNRTQQQQQPRYVTRVEINPVNPADPTSGGGPATVTSESHAKPPVAPKQPQPTPTKQSGNVRHIPIFVEGRDEPVLSKNVGTEKVEQVFPPREQVFTSQHSPQSFARPSPFGSHHFYQQSTPAPQAPRGFQQPQSPKVQRQAKPQPPQQQPPRPQQQQQPQQPQQQPPRPQQQPQQHQQPPQQQHQPPSANDPIYRVQVIQKDVEELKAKVEQYSGSSRDKAYMYLDEMLTRNLLKLDDIDTEGKENVRQARRDAIRSIQKCISVLEGKVPTPDEKKEQSTDENMEPLTEEAPMETAEESQTTETAESDKTEASAPPAESKMEVVQGESATKDAVPDNVSEQVVADATPVANGQTNENVQSDAVKPEEEQKMDVTENKESNEAVPEESGEVKEQIPMEVEEQKPIPETTQPENPQTEISQPDASQTESPQHVTKPVKKKVAKKGAKKDSASAEKTDKSASGDSNKVPEPTPVSENKDSSTAPAETSTPQPKSEKSS